MFSKKQQTKSMTMYLEFGLQIILMNLVSCRGTSTDKHTITTLTFHSNISKYIYWIKQKLIK